MRPRIRTNCWLCIVTSLAMAVSGLPLPIRTLTSNARACANLLSWNFSRISNGCGLAITSATPRRVSVDADSSDIDEEDEYESFWSISHLVCPTFLPSASPSKLLSGPSLGNPPPRTAAVPLRC